METLWGGLSLTLTILVWLCFKDKLLTEVEFKILQVKIKAVNQ